MDAALPRPASRSDFPVWPWWILGGVMVVIFCVQDYANTDHGVISGAVYWGRDFINVWTGGHIVRDGRLDLLYDLKGYSEYQRALFGSVGPHNYSYPPISYPLAAAFSLLPYPVALAAWTLGTGALFVWAARPWWPRQAGPVWLAALTPAALVNIWAGHYGFLIGALFLLGWRRLDDRPIQAGIFFGLMLIKPHLAVLIPVALLVRRDWRTIASAAATAFILIAVTTLWFGWQPWYEFLFRTSAVQASMIDAGNSFFGLMSASPATAVLRIVPSVPAAVIVQCIFAAAGIWMVARAAALGADTADLALLTATATFLVLPYSFTYDLTVVMVGAVVLLSRSDLDLSQQRLATYGFIAPQVGVITATIGFPFTPLMLAGLAAAQFRLIRLRPAPPDSAFNRHTALAN